MKNARGFGLVELVVGSAILSVVLLGLAGVTTASLQLARDNERRTQATLLLEEGLEAARSVRDYSWINLANAATSTPLGISWSSGRWVFGSGSTTVGVFTRSVIVSDVYRDGNQDIAESGTLDPNTKKITSYVSWERRAGEATLSLEGYVTNLFE